MKKRNEAARQKKMDHIFAKFDDNGNGKITADQMVKLFAAHDVTVNTIEDDVINIRDKEGWITRNEFIKYAMDTDLCKTEIQDRVFSQPVWASDSEPKKKSKDASKKDSRKLDPSKMDRVELAFRKFDTNNDGYLIRDEFDVMMKNVSREQADRIFKSCDTSGDDRISLDEFRTMLNKAPNMGGAAKDSKGGAKSSKKGGSNVNTAPADVTASPAKISSQASTGAISKNIQKDQK
jgi:Ca2+-binding EF-hand superfamily protein